MGLGQTAAEEAGRLTEALVSREGGVSASAHAHYDQQAPAVQRGYRLPDGGIDRARYGREMESATAFAVSAWDRLQGFLLSAGLRSAPPPATERATPAAPPQTAPPEAALPETAPAGAASPRASRASTPAIPGAALAAGLLVGVVLLARR